MLGAGILEWLDVEGRWVCEYGTCDRWGEALIDELRNPLALVEFCLLISGLAISMLGLLLAWTLWSLGAATAETLVADVPPRFSRIDLAERVDRLDEDRCRRADVEVTVLPVPVVVVDGSPVKKWSEVEEVVDATDAV